MTTSGLSLKTLAGRVSLMVTGALPQSKVILPPRATAWTNWSAVQLSGVPVPMTVSGEETSSASPSAGTREAPAGLPAAGPVDGSVGT